MKINAVKMSVDEKSFDKYALCHCASIGVY